MTLQDRFRRSILHGTGEAVQIALANSSVDFSCHIIYACTHRIVYEAQGSDNREQYYAALIKLSPKSDYILSELIEHLQTKDEDWYVLELIFAILKESVAFKPSLKRAIYDAFTPSFIIEHGNCGLDSIIEMDGFDGLLFVCDIIGKAMELNSEYWEWSTFIDNYQDDHSERDVWSILREQAQVKSSIAKLLAHFKEQDEDHEEHHGKKAKLTYDELMKRISENVTILMHPREKDDLSDTDLEKLAENFRSEKSQDRLLCFLKIFWRRKYPGNPSDIIPFANSNDTTIRDYAIYCLEHFNDLSVREFALDKIQNSPDQIAFIDLLRLNFKQEDVILLSNLARKFRSPYKMEMIAHCCVGILENNPGADLTSVCEILYRKMTCGMCRNDIVGHMLKKHSLPKWIESEIRYDSLEATRALVCCGKDPLKEIIEM